MKRIVSLTLIFLLIFFISVFAQQPAKMVNVEFTPAEVESMLFLYNDFFALGLYA